MITVFCFYRCKVGMGRPVRWTSMSASISPVRGASVWTPPAVTTVTVWAMGLDTQVRENFRHYSQHPLFLKLLDIHTHIEWANLQTFCACNIHKLFLKFRSILVREIALTWISYYDSLPTCYVKILCIYCLVRYAENVTNLKCSKIYTENFFTLMTDFIFGIMLKKVLKN